MLSYPINYTIRPTKIINIDLKRLELPILQLFM